MTAQFSGPPGPLLPRALRAALLTLGLCLSLAACVGPSAPPDPSLALNTQAGPSNL